jgi:hypothetical protein
MAEANDVKTMFETEMKETFRLIADKRKSSKLLRAVYDIGKALYWDAYSENDANLGPKEWCMRAMRFYYEVSHRLRKSIYFFLCVCRFVYPTAIPRDVALIIAKLAFNTEHLEPYRGIFEANEAKSWRVSQ